MTDESWTLLRSQVHDGPAVVRLHRDIEDRKDKLLCPLRNDIVRHEDHRKKSPVSRTEEEVASDEPILVHRSLPERWR